MDLFGENEAHDPGGKVRSRLLPGVNGDAVFAGERDVYRTILRRWEGEEFPERFAMSIGMNPSTADQHVNDSTLIRDWSFAKEWGFRGLVKCNVSAYRLTDSKKLEKQAAVLDYPGNLPTILEYAERAAVVVLAHGVLPKPMRPLADRLISELRQRGVDLKCFAKTADGSPKHSLYVAGGTPLIPY